MIAVTFIVIFLVFWIAYEIAVTHITRKRVKRLEDLLCSEDTQRCFAENRIRLMRLAMEDKVSPNSVIFKFLYHFNTGLMRRPEQYAAISSSILNALQSNSANQIRIDLRKMSPEVRDIVAKSANAMNYLIVHQLRSRRLIFFIGSHPLLVKYVGKSLGRIIARMTRQQEEKSPLIAEMRKTQRAMNRLASV